MQDEEFFGILTCFVEYCQSSVGTTVKCGFGVGLGRGREGLGRGDSVAVNLIKFLPPTFFWG